MDVSGSLNVGPLGTTSSGLVFQDGTFQNTAATSNVYNFGQNLQPFTQLNNYAGNIDPSFNLANLDCLNASATVQYMVACTSDSPSPSRIAMSSDYGDVWFDITSRVQAASLPLVGPVEAIAVTLSETGQYITIVDSSSAGIYTSNNYGQTFTNTPALTSALTPIGLTSACMSYSGQYQLTVGRYGGVDLSATFQSIDYGQTWASRSTTLDSSGGSCAMSGTGQYQAICGPNTTGLYYSNNYGTDFSNITQGITQLDLSYNGLAFSYSGQYITLAPSGPGGGILVSNYYGQVSPNSWISRGLGGDGIFSLSISNTGQYQLAVPSTQSPQINGFYISSDFGNNWTLVNTSFGSFAPSGSTPVNTSIVSSSGQRLVVWDNSYNQVYISESSPAQIAWVLDSSNNIINNTLYASVGINKMAGVGFALDVDGSANFAGQLYATSLHTTSDYRIKDNVVQLDNLFTVDNLNPVTYTNTRTLKQDVGFIAHELQEVYPFLVNGLKDGEQFQSVNYIGLIGILTKEIQEIKERVKILEEK